MLAAMERGKDSNCTADQEDKKINIEIEKLGTNSRRIRAKIVIDASFDVVWSVLIDYEKLVDTTPSIVAIDIIERKGNFVRVCQIAEKHLPFGLKIKTKAILDYYEKDPEISAAGKKSDVEFKMVEGDFQLYEGKWTVEQYNKPTSGDTDSDLGQEFATSISYVVDVKPKLWLPVNLFEGLIYKEIKANLTGIRDEAQKMKSLQAQ